MKQTRLGLQLSVEIHKAGITKTLFSQQSKLSPAMINRILYDSTLRIGPGSLEKICTAMKKHKGDINILIAHLRDEIHRAGYIPEKTIEIKDISRIQKQERLLTLELFSELALDNDDLYCIIIDMLKLMGKNAAGKTTAYPELHRTEILKAAEE